MALRTAVAVEGEAVRDLAGPRLEPGERLRTPAGDTGAAAATFPRDVRARLRPGAEFAVVAPAAA